MPRSSTEELAKDRDDSAIFRKDAEDILNLSNNQADVNKYNDLIAVL